MNHLAIPEPKVPIAFRVGTRDDIPFMDALQKRHGRALGYFPTKQFEGYVEMGAVLIAEKTEESPRRHGDTEGDLCSDADSQIQTLEQRNSDCDSASNGARASVPQCLRGERLGYVISRDRYLKRDELGVIFQLCVAPGAQRKLVGASLVGEAFARSAYGCRLYCLWCAQDLEANHFWASLGFVPIAFRVGSDRRRRVHIFWQRRIDDDDEGDAGRGGTKWWYPYQTTGGAIRQDRVVFPIPPGVRWQDVRAVEVPGMNGVRASRRCLPKPKKNTGETPVLRKGPGPGMVGILVGGRIKYVPRPGYVAGTAPAPRVAPAVPPSSRALPAPKPRRERAPKPACDKAFLAKARELRDRWLEHVNAGEMQIESAGKYEVVRQRQRHLGATAVPKERLPLLPAA